MTDYKIYYEHFGLISNNKNKSFKENQYEKESIGKKEIHKKYNTTLMCTYGYEFYKDDFNSIIEKKLKDLNVKIEIKSDDEILDQIKQINLEVYDQFINFIIEYFIR